MKNSSTKLPSRFWKKTEAIPECGCLLWTGALYANGYGAFRIDGTTRLAHRLAYENEFGKIPESLFVCHRCDVRCCVNPHHLFAGTASENSRDRDRKGRTALKKLTREQVQEILNSKESSRKLAARFGVGHQTVLAHRKRHDHAEEVQRHNSGASQPCVPRKE